ncbi:MAG: helix-turn-helix transcriptional regulator [Promethearchaeota archaeon]
MSPSSTLSKTKQKIIAIMYHLEKNDDTPYGYKIWKLLSKLEKELGSPDIRNVYRHLNDLCELQYVAKGTSENPKDAPPRQVYQLTEEGKDFAESIAKGVLERLESSVQ